jgi:mRNA interferase MazF
MPESGDVVLVTLKFTDGGGYKRRPALVLYGEFGNLIVAGITSNTRMGGISLSVEDGAIKPSVIKLNYLFTIPDHAIEKYLFPLSIDKRREVLSGFMTRLRALDPDQT